MKQFTSKTQKIGEYGEKICAKWLQNNGFTILEKNFTTKKGEIDIICKKSENIHFIEVKSTLNKEINVSYETNNTIADKNRSSEYNPAENVNKNKIRKCYKTICEYIRLNKVSHETKYQFDVYIIYIDTNNIKHKIQKIENVVYE